MNWDPKHSASIVAMLDEQQRVVRRITPTKVLFQE
jgi:hypothetical protein